MYVYAKNEEVDPNYKLNTIKCKKICSNMDLINEKYVVALGDYCRCAKIVMKGKAKFCKDSFYFTFFSSSRKSNEKRPCVNRLQNILLFWLWW
jgi:hypothetical protein